MTHLPFYLQLITLHLLTGNYSAALAIIKRGR